MTSNIQFLRQYETFNCLYKKCDQNESIVLVFIESEMQFDRIYKNLTEHFKIIILELARKKMLYS